MRAVRRINAAEHHRVDLLVARQRLLRGVFGGGDRVAHLGFGNALNRSRNVPYLARREFVLRLWRGGEHAHFRNVELVAGRHGANAHARLYRAVKHAHIRERALVVIVDAVKHQRGERLFRFPFGRRHQIDHGGKHFIYVRAVLGGDHRRVLGFNADNILNLLRGALRLCARQVDLVDDRNDLQTVVHGKVDVRQRLRFNALGRVHNKHRAFAGG
jgi:hypothetical protein